jgi:hypothetical protein
MVARREAVVTRATSHRAARIDALAERLTRKSAYEVYKPFLPWFDHGFWVKSSDLIMPRRRNRDG